MHTSGMTKATSISPQPFCVNHHRAHLTATNRKQQGTLQTTSMQIIFSREEFFACEDTNLKLQIKSSRLILPNYRHICSRCGSPFVSLNTDIPWNWPILRPHATCICQWLTMHWYSGSLLLFMSTPIEAHSPSSNHHNWAHGDFAVC